MIQLERLLLKDKVVIVTGGAGLLGRAFCNGIMAHGGIAIIADKNVTAAQQIADSLYDTYPGQLVVVDIDITNKASILEAIKVSLQYSNVIHAVVNNAYPHNANYGKRMEDVTYDDFCENVGMHLGGYFLVAQQFASFFTSQGHGNIINMSSIYGVIAPRFDIYKGTSMTMAVEYAAIKAGVVHLTRYFARYLGGTGIRVNAISPGGIFDHQNELFLENYNAYCTSKGMLDKNDVTGTLLFLLSDLSEFITGQNIVVDDGFTL